MYAWNSVKGVAANNSQDFNLQKLIMLMDNIDLIYKISSITAVMAALITAFAGGIQWYSGKIIADKQEAKVIAIEKDARIKKPTIFSQTSVSLNVSEGNLFVQKYLISINSPTVHIPLYTNILYNPANGPIERVGEMQINDVGGGVRKVEDEDISYVDTEYTLKTNRALKENEYINFSLEKH